MAIRTDVDHLPGAKKREFERVVEILFEEFGDANSHAKAKRRVGRILKIIRHISSTFPLASPLQM